MTKNKSVFLTYINWLAQCCFLYILIGLSASYGMSPVSPYYVYPHHGCHEHDPDCPEYRCKKPFPFEEIDCTDNRTLWQVFVEKKPKECTYIYNTEKTFSTSFMVREYSDDECRIIGQASCLELARQDILTACIWNEDCKRQFECYVGQRYDNEEAFNAGRIRGSYISPWFIMDKPKNEVTDL